MAGWPEKKRKTDEWDAHGAVLATVQTTPQQAFLFCCNKKMTYQPRNREMWCFFHLQSMGGWKREGKEVWIIHKKSTF